MRRRDKYVATPDGLRPGTQLVVDDIVAEAARRAARAQRSSALGAVRVLWRAYDWVAGPVVGGSRPGERRPRGTGLEEATLLALTVRWCRLSGTRC